MEWVGNTTLAKCQKAEKCGKCIYFWTDLELIECSVCVVKKLNVPLV